MKNAIRLLPDEIEIVSPAFKLFAVNSLDVGSTESDNNIRWFPSGCLLTFGSVSPSITELPTLLKADWLRPNLMKEEPIVLRLSLESVSSLRSSMPCLFIMYSNSFGDSLKILKLPSSFNGVSTEEDANIQLQRNAIALKAQSAICN